MKRITINNYQYWYNEATGKLYEDEAGTTEVTKQSFTAQEMIQFYNALRDLNQIQYKDRDTFKYALKVEGDFGSTDEDLRLARGSRDDIWSGL